jgi:hypothetical protein
MTITFKKACINSIPALKPSKFQAYCIQISSEKPTKSQKHVHTLSKSHTERSSKRQKAGDNIGKNRQIVDLLTHFIAFSLLDCKKDH